MSRPFGYYVPSVLRNDRLTQFYVVTCYFNPCGYQNRLRNYLRFARNLQRQRVNLLTVQLRTHAGDDRLPADSCARLVDIVEPDILWAKECLLNVALAALPAECTQVCWCDCDIVFERDGWAVACSEMLQRYRVVQPFAHSRFLWPSETPSSQIFRSPLRTSFARQHVARQAVRSTGGNSNKGGGDDDDGDGDGNASLALAGKAVYAAHPGYAWAARRETLAAMGGLCDLCILGHADLAMALAFTHDPDRHGALPAEWTGHWQPAWSPALRAAVRRWQIRAADVVRGDVGCVGGTIFHLWHGPPKRRFYHERAEILGDLDPARDLRRASTGVWRWTERARSRGVPERVLAYFRARTEDSGAHSERALGAYGAAGQPARRPGGPPGRVVRRV